MSYLQNLIDGYSTEGAEELDLDTVDYSTECLIQDQQRVVRLMQGVERLTTSFESGHITLARYNEDVALVFTTTGLRLPSTIITPEFEAEDTSPKKQNLFMRLVQYLMEKLKQFYNWFFVKDTSPIEKAKTQKAQELKQFSESASRLKPHQDKKTSTASAKPEVSVSGTTKPSDKKKMYLSSMYVTQGVFDFAKFQDVYQSTVALNQQIQNFDSSNDTSGLHTLFGKMEALSKTIKEKELAEIADTPELTHGRLTTLVDTKLQPMIDRYLKDLDRSTRDFIRDQQNELKSLSSKKDKTDSDRAALQEIEAALEVLTLQTKMGPFLSTIGTMLKDVTKIVESL